MRKNMLEILVMCGNIEGNRAHGRPRKTFARQLEGYVDKNCNQILRTADNR